MTEKKSVNLKIDLYKLSNAKDRKEKRKNKKNRTSGTMRQHQNVQPMFGQNYKRGERMMQK